VTIQSLIQQAWPLLTVFVFVFGASVGSFLNVCSWRLPRGESLVHPGSHCPHCGHAIAPWENIPLLSWLLLRGRCSACRGPISLRYPLIEGTTAVVFTAVWWRLTTLPGVTWEALPGAWFLAAVCIAAAVIDLEHRIVPDRLTFPALIAALVLAVLFPHGRMIGDWVGASPLPAHFWTLTALDFLSPYAPGLVARPRVAAVIDCALGAGVAAVFLLLVRETARRFFGSVKQVWEDPVQFVATGSGLRIGDGPLLAWNDLLGVGSATAEIHVREGRAVYRAAAAPESVKEDRLQLHDEVVLVSRRGVRFRECSVPLPALLELTGELDYCRLPREVLGLGDVKLHAVIGAFLGPEASMMIAFLAAVLGTMYGIVQRLVLKSRTPIPFAPFLAGAALLWILAAATITDVLGLTVLRSWRLRFPPEPTPL